MKFRKPGGGFFAQLNALLATVGRIFGTLHQLFLNKRIDELRRGAAGDAQLGGQRLYIQAITVLSQQKYYGLLAAGEGLLVECQIIGTDGHSPIYYGQSVHQLF
jgi:hypothetical protein